MKIHFREQYGSTGEEILYVTPDNQNSVVRVNVKGEKPKLRKRLSLKRFLQNLFLPAGYPDSVSSDYLAYQRWDTVQAFCSTISGTLTTHSILKGVGVGSDMANPLSATVTWVLKDGTGHFGRILFAWWKGTELDIDSKKWRIRADILNDVAMAIDLFVLPCYPKAATFILCATTTMKAIVGVAGGATRSALTQHHAIRGNLADVASKDSAQETCVNLIASFIGLFLLTHVQEQRVLYGLFLFSILLHIYANIKAVKAVCLRTFNEARYLITLEEYFKTGTILSPEQVNKLERVTIGQTVSLTARVEIGCSARELGQYYRNCYDLENVIACFDSREKFLISETRRYVGVYLHFTVKPLDIIKSYFYVASYLQDKNQLRDRYWEIQNKWNEFLNLAQCEGWNVQAHLLKTDEYRLDWRI
ncbi:RUS family member 1-like [Topomyia yanbarensis]|uniref:RUS family member 1-like n=1 Tax=Topomyia yanbarensis TaxID=2498891 RepID=UPI00273A91B1|nr:RUS family member 1-like [Topomyia yanbarensis]